MACTTTVGARPRRGPRQQESRPAGKAGCSRGDTAYTGERPHSQDQRTQSDYTTRRTNVVYSKSVNYPYGSVSPEATCRLYKEVEGTVGACQLWMASLLDNQSTNKDGIAAARGIMTGLEFNLCKSHGTGPMGLSMGVHGRPMGLKPVSMGGRYPAVHGQDFHGTVHGTANSANIDESAVYIIYAKLVRIFK
ncbi:hypothetical protein TSTA_127070 [Talaromyces stipitatus ATCC 10500]|uniref:Uncharacterized protein n=1 Tax=Talaromyces stipitatus (strain ATCC 10500 / CBS 375.48 / QM 6759 / NRRL 1006) TaxID=441959 RepID=B8MCU7_TALSN|nr:uncharacterized protein TSTA_127070 [Talaromyces stipitatus ATCC 10500]EED18999.1 hypothetical protein TSTA_127070 [Talaromyces stipitatus ATCC 10500]